MAQYIDETYIEARLGSGYVDAVQAVTGVYLSTIIIGATANVQGVLKSAGWSTPETTTDEGVKLAVFGVCREMIADVPDAAQPLPDDWGNRAENPRFFLRAIASGDIVVLSGHSLDKTTAVGGWLTSDNTSTGLPKRATKSELAGF